MSIDGYLDDGSPDRLVLSGPEDLDRVDAVRASVDAILVGAGTVRADDPRLLVRSADRRAARIASGLPENPIKVALTRGDIDPGRAFFTAGPAEKIVYGPAALRDSLGELATVVDLDDLGAILADLSARGVRRLMVEGGGAVHTQFLSAGLVDELQLVVAPFFVGEAEAPRFVRPARFPYTALNRLRLEATEQIGDCALLTYRTERG
ncbi:deaminase [Pseudonocardiaceae bacterium YIM PH 21723]|nr:deaminase [Pseudonocardiaceae bacterium YIM PH 21723]